MTIAIKAKGLAGLESYFRALPDVAERSIVLAINDVTSKKGLTLLRKTAREQINFPKGYLESKQHSRLVLYRKAYVRRPEATIRARDRATSLARFATPGQVPGMRLRNGVRLQVDAGKQATMRRAWLLRLRGGNVGLAMRFRPGEEPSNTTGAVPMGKNFPNIWLFYGPSVEQVMDDVFDDKADDLFKMIRKEFFRQFTRLARNA